MSSNKIGIFNTWGQSPIKNRKSENQQKVDKVSQDIRHSKRPVTNTKLICILCMAAQPSGKLFQCQHELLCSECAEKYTKASLQKSQTPTCAIKHCHAKMADNSQLIESKFSINTQQKLKAYKLKSSFHNTLQVCRPCILPNCPGFIDPNTYTCPLCQSVFCKSCFKQKHEGQCLSATLFPENMAIKLCKFCNGKMYKEGGCPKFDCPTCNTTICYECGQIWSFMHHGCEKGGWASFFSNCMAQLCGTDQKNQEHQIFIH